MAVVLALWTDFRHSWPRSERTPNILLLTLTIRNTKLLRNQQHIRYCCHIGIRYCYVVQVELHSFHCRRLEASINSLPKPLVISCKSNRRAGAVYAAYKVFVLLISLTKATSSESLLVKAVQSGLSVPEILDYSTSKG